MTCENCRALYARIERADRVMVALKHVILAWNTEDIPSASEEEDVIAAYNAYCAAELDARIAEARTDEPAPKTQRSVDEIVERSR